MLGNKNERASRLKRVMAGAIILPTAVIVTGKRTAVYFQERVRWGDPYDYGEDCFVPHNLEQGLRRDVANVWRAAKDGIRQASPRVFLEELD